MELLHFVIFIAGGMLGIFGMCIIVAGRCCDYDQIRDDLYKAKKTIEGKDEIIRSLDGINRALQNKLKDERIVVL
jgi:hypothetical protein